MSSAEQTRESLWCERIFKKTSILYYIPGNQTENFAVLCPLEAIAISSGVVGYVILNRHADTLAVVLPQTLTVQDRLLASRTSPLDDRPSGRFRLLAGALMVTGQRAQRVGTLLRCLVHPVAGLEVAHEASKERCEERERRHNVLRTSMINMGK